MRNTTIKEYTDMIINEGNEDGGNEKSNMNKQELQIEENRESRFNTAQKMAE